MERFKVIILISFVCFSFFAGMAQQDSTVIIIDDYALLKNQAPSSLVNTPLKSKYLIGSIRFIMADSSLVTPSGVAIKVYQIQEDESEKLLTMATTNGKGLYYLTMMNLGCFKLKIENWGEVICERYFILTDVNQKKLEVIVIPMAKIEEKTQQKKNYEEF